MQSTFTYPTNNLGLGISSQTTSASEHQLKFSVVGSDRELMRQISVTLRQHGILNIAYGNGVAHYLVDGRTDKVRAAKLLLNEVQSTNYLATIQREFVVRNLYQMVDSVLNRYCFNRELKGYSYLRYALVLLMQDEDLLLALGKYLYPKIAINFNANEEQVARNLRYLFEQLFLEENTKSEETAKLLRYQTTSTKSLLKAMLLEVKEFEQVEYHY